MITQEPAATATNGELPFLDAATAHALEWPSFWAEFQPVTPFGERAKEAMSAYLPEQSANLEGVLQQLRNDLAAHNAPVWEFVRSALPDFPDIDEELKILSAGSGVLSQKQLMVMKQFAIRGWQLARAESMSLVTWTSSDDWQCLALLFGDVTTTSFTISHVAGAGYQALARLVANAQGDLASATRVRNRLWKDKTGKWPRADGEIAFRFPEEREIADAIWMESGIAWLRDTPFERVYELLPTADMMACSKVLQTRQNELEMFVTQTITDLCGKLRLHLGLWQRAAKQLAQLDLRAAKVRMALRWRGTAPVLADTVELIGGVHPLVARRLEAKGKHYVPLTVAPQFGMNLIFGSNMGGKTVAMSLLVICQALTQFGLPVPARAFQTCLFAGLRYAAGSESNVGSGLSSFGREVVKIAEIWREITAAGNLLVCFDEPARCTNPKEGEAIVVGIMESVQSRLHKHLLCMMATHYPAAIRVPVAGKFRVQGLSHSALRFDEQTSGDPVTSGEAQTHCDAVAGSTASSAVSPEERLTVLETMLDYRVQPADDSDIPEEALQIAKWLGLPDVMLEASHKFLQRGG